MSTLQLNGKDLASQTSSAECVIASAVTGSPTIALTNATGTMPNGTQDNITRLGTVATGNLSNTAIVYPAGHVIQTTFNTHDGVTSDSQASAVIERVHQSTNYFWKGTIDNVKASSEIIITMSWTMSATGNNQEWLGVGYGLFRDAAGAGAASFRNPADYQYTFDTADEAADTDYNIWLRQSETWIDTSPATGTNIYYLAYSVYSTVGGSTAVMTGSSSGTPFICVLQEIAR